MLRSKPNRRPSQHASREGEYTDRKFIPTVIDNAICEHSPDGLTPCWAFTSPYSGRPILGVCNERAKRAGFNHPISDFALRRAPRRSV
jgi:hypothetical protein